MQETTCSSYASDWECNSAPLFADADGGGRCYRYPQTRHRWWSPSRGHCPFGKKRVLHESNPIVIFFTEFGRDFLELGYFKAKFQ
uniref:Uncharacterized protein n=1 Tax=Cannabis sativa TaxID=3483 RepID=A0A803Q8H6_CANSA